MILIDNDLTAADLATHLGCDGLTAVRILDMIRTDSAYNTTAGEARVRECYHAPSYSDVALHAIDAELQTHGVEGWFDEYRQIGVSYCNSGDSYGATIVYLDDEYGPFGAGFWAGDLGTFIEQVGSHPHDVEFTVQADTNDLDSLGIDPEALDFTVDDWGDCELTFYGRAYMTADQYPTVTVTIHAVCDSRGAGEAIEEGHGLFLDILARWEFEINEAGREACEW